jgi:hypothetical protein
MGFARFLADRWRVKTPAMNVYFTVDTESSMGGAWRHPERRPLKADRHVFCRIDGEDHGIGLITRALSRYGFRATHFVETLATLVNGDDDTRVGIDYLLEHGQDVQLHIHPTYHFYAEALAAREEGRPYQPDEPNDFLSAFDEARQMELLEQASMLYRRFTGSSPVAFRAGCYAANRITLRCLKKLGIFLDSSLNPCHRSCSFPDVVLEPNRVCEIEGVWELPVTVARTPLPEGHGGLKTVDPCALSLSELRSILETGAAQGQQHFVIIFHSFAAVKPKDEMYSAMRPDRIVSRRLEKLMEYLSSRPDLYRVKTFGELAGELPLVADTNAPLAEVGLVASALRKSVQGLNRWYWL